MQMKLGKEQLWKWTGVFFASMLLFTILSRAIYQNSVTAVTTEAPSNGTIAHRVVVSGKTIQNQELAVTTVGGLRVALVQVNEGQQVKQGDVLFTLDSEYLQETITYQKQEMQKQKLSIQDAMSQNSASQQQRSNAQKQAQESYHSAVSSAQTVLDRAERDLDRAKAALEAYYDGESAAQTEEALLAAACRDAKEDYDAAVLAMEQLNGEIETKIQAAIAQAALALSQAQPVLETGPNQTGENSQEAAGDQLPAAEFPENRTLTQEEMDRIAQEIRAEYASAVQDAELLVQQTRKAMEDADAALAAFQQENADMPARSEQELIDAVEAAQERCDDALAALNNAETTYGRAIASSNLPSASNSSAQIGQITYDQMAVTLEKLAALQASGGEILAPVDGVVTGSFVQAGEKTTDSTAVRLADISQGCKFSGVVSEAQSQYIGVGDKVIIQAGSNGKLYKDLPVTTLSSTEEVGGGYRITVQLPPGSLPLGAAAELQFTRKSQPYALCVPLSALHLDERNQPYILTAETVNTVLGPQLQAQKIAVTILDQNETMAALEEGAVSPEQQIIVGFDKAIEPGSRVRLT